MSYVHIEEAYCIECGRNVTIFEANDYYFSLPAAQRKRLHFECPDEQCREKHHPKITGVNYDKEIFVMPMHFRRNMDSIHSDNCSLDLNEKILREMQRKKRFYRNKSDRNLFLDLPASDTFPDVFQPRRDVENRRICKNAPPKKHDKENNRSRQAIENRICHTKYKTRSLKTVVDAFEKLDINQRDIPSLSIEGRKMTYGTAFKHIRFMEEWHTWPHIYYGSARIFRYRDGFRAFFDERVRKYLPEKTALETSIFFPLKKGEIPSEHPYEALERAAKTKEHCCIYMFASKTLVIAPLGSSGDSKEWIRLDSAPGETVITFNDRLCI